MTSAHDDLFDALGQVATCEHTGRPLARYRRRPIEAGVQHAVSGVFVAVRPAGCHVEAGFAEVNVPAAGFAFAPAVAAVSIGSETYLAVMIG